MTLNNGQALLWIWLITQADDQGRLHGDPAVLSRRFRRLSPGQVSAALGAMQCRDMVTLYEVEGTPYVALTHWREHQRIDRPRGSTLPAPPNSKSPDSTNVRRKLDEASSMIRRPKGPDRKGGDLDPKGRDRKGSDPPSPPSGGSGSKDPSTACNGALAQGGSFSQALEQIRQQRRRPEPAS